MKKVLILFIGLLFITDAFSQIQTFPVDQLLQNEINLQPAAATKQAIQGHLQLDKSLQLTADQFVNGKKSVLCSAPQSNLRKTTTQQSKAGRTHHRYQQTWNGVPIEGKYVLLHEDNGILNSINGETVTGLSINTTPSLSESLALTKALDNSVNYAWQNAAMETDLKADKNDPSATYHPKGQLVILPGNQTPNSNYKLAWQFNLFSIDPHDHIQVVVDAHSGMILRKKSLIKHTHVQGDGATNYDGNQQFTCKHKGHHYELDNTSIETRKFKGSFFGNGQPYTSLDTSWNTNPAAVDVHWGTEKFVEFLNVELGRNGYDGNGKKIRALVGYPFQNAFWNGYFLGYGVGDSTTISSPTSLDIVGHEYTHAMLDEIVGFQYGGESGAIEEAYSDIFGELIEHYVKGTADWKAGGEITQTNGQANNLGLRNLADPNSRNAPSVYKGLYWHNSPSDNWGVHTNSSVYSYWFHLVAFGNGSTVNGVGLSAATELIYETLFYLQPYADYIDLRNSSMVAAGSLPQFTPSMLADVEAAWSIVGLGLSAPAIITGIIPAAGQTLYSGIPTIIEWDTTLSITLVDVEYSINGGVSWQDIAVNQSYGSGKLAWLVPPINSNTTLIRVSESGNPAVRGTSTGYFTILSTNNRSPIAFDDTIYTTQGYFVDFNAWKNDMDEDKLDTTSVSIVVGAQPNEGTTYVNANGTIRVNVDAAFVGTFSFQYSICDLGMPVLCDTATVMVHSAKAPNPRWAMDDWGVLNLNDTLSRNLMLNDYLLDSSWHFAGWDVVRLNHGSISVDTTTGDYTYLPNAMGRDTVSYVVSNGLIWDTAYLNLFVVEDRLMAKDSMDLVILYEMTDGPNWDSTWNLATPVTGWYGVYTYNTQIHRLELTNNNLIGHIPDFSTFDHLLKLRLNKNQLTGSIPAFLNLNNLTNLNLEYNSLTGEIPTFSTLNNLTLLAFSSNNLTGRIPAFSNLTKLANLRLTNNQLTGAIPSFSTLNDLYVLSLDYNQLTGNIPAFSTNTDLTNLFLNNNQLRGTIPGLETLNSLAKLHLDHNQLSGKIPTFSTLNNLSNLFLSNNQLVDTIPDFSTLLNLVFLDLSYNKLTGDIPILLNLVNLAHLDLSYNQLTGGIPEFSTLLSLGCINLNHNQLTDTIPSFSTLIELTHIEVSYNQLSGVIPDFSTLPNLADLNLMNNKFTFDGMEHHTNLNTFYYNPQSNIPLYNSNTSLFVNPGGDSTLNTFFWHNLDDNTIDIIQGTNYFSPTTYGNYYCFIKNDSITNPNRGVQNLVLQSDTVYFEPTCNIQSVLEETLTVCLADTLDAGYSKMAAYQWLLNSQVVGTGQKLFVNQAGTYILQMQDSCMNPAILDTIVVMIDSSCIWPGDTNLDGIVNHYDLQNIGLHYGATGPARSHDSVQFVPALGINWNQQTNAGLDLKHVDANGDGLINSSDTTIILNHYGRSWGSYLPPIDSSSSPIQIVPKITSVPQGVNGDFTIVYALENSLDTSIQFYGLAFETRIQSPIDISKQVQIDSSQLQGAQQFLTISAPSDTNVVQTAFTKTDLSDAILQDSTTALFTSSLGTELNLPTGDTVSIIQVSVENVRLTTVNSSFNSGQFGLPLQGGTSTIYFTEALAFSLTPKRAHCAANGAIEVNLLKGTPPYQFHWSANANGATSANITGLTTGTYEVTISDAQGKTITAATTVEGINGITANPTIKNPTGSQSNGSIALNLSGGNGGYTVQWSTGQAGSAISHLSAGDYIALVADDRACVESFFVHLENGIRLDLNVFLEGALETTNLLMTDFLRSNSLIPTLDPYDSLVTVSSLVFNTTGPDAIVDWVYIELADFNFSTQYSIPVLLQRDGDLVDLDGLTNPIIQQVLPGSYFVIIRHRNHLPIASPIAFEIGAGVIQYDFTSSNSYTSGVGFGQKQLKPGVWAMYAGNGKQTGTQQYDINVIDKIFWNNSNGIFLNYLDADYNLDADVNAYDKIITQQNNGIFSSFKP